MLSFKKICSFQTKLHETPLEPLKHGYSYSTCFLYTLDERQLAAALLTIRPWCYLCLTVAWLMDMAVEHANGLSAPKMVLYDSSIILVWFKSLFWEHVFFHFSAPVMEPNTHPQHTLMIEENASHSMEVDPKRARFPCCIVWTPLPLLSWFIPFVGHLGICREDGVILDFAGPNYVCVDNFAFGAPTCYFQIGKDQVYLSISFRTEMY